MIATTPVALVVSKVGHKERGHAVDQLLGPGDSFVKFSFEMLKKLF